MKTFVELKIPDVRNDTKQCFLGKLGNSIFEGTWEIEISSSRVPPEIFSKVPRVAGSNSHALRGGSERDSKGFTIG